MAPKKQINPTSLNQIRHYENLLKAKKFSVDKLIIFGSQTKGTTKPWSDIDICVVSPQFGHNRFEERLMLLKLKDNQSNDIEPHPFHPKDLDNKYDTLAQEIKKYGVIV